MDDNKIYLNRINLFLKEKPKFRDPITGKLKPIYTEYNINIKYIKNIFTPGLLSTKLDKFKYQEFLKIENKVLFKFNNSFTVLKDGVFSSEGVLKIFE
jgi:hypothetical protein